ncbi:hypothetical protein BT69DRAFT_1275388 [Atractiella rhizophila]|nr:hypothetical protein BT69DRAFT_1275388 [Atractiella rhizophila]
MATITLDQIAQMLNAFQTQLSDLQETLCRRFDVMEGRLNVIENRMDAIDQR